MGIPLSLARKSEREVSSSAFAVREKYNDIAGKSPPETWYVDDGDSVMVTEMSVSSRDYGRASNFPSAAIFSYDFKRLKFTM